MSIQVANIDLSAATVGTAGSIPIGQATPPPTIAQQMRPMQNQEGGPSLFVWNESGCGLTCLWPDSRETFTLPAGQWRLLHIPPAETQLNYLVSYIIPNAPVSLLLADLYVPGEPIDPMGVLGNSPIGVSGQVSTSVGQSIKNDGNVPATQIIEATPSDQGSSSVSINNDASGFLQVLSANVLRKILNVVRGNSGAGKASIQLGDSGDTSITTFYGTVGAGSVVPGATVAGAVASAGSVPASGVAAGTLAAGVHQTQINSDGGAITSNGTGTLTATGTVFANEYVGAQGVDLLVAAFQFGAVAEQVKLVSWDGSAGHTGVTVQANGVAQLGTDDAGTKRLIQEFEGTSDPAGRAGITVNEGDVWFNG